jgi:hypothetical protein
MKNIERKSLTLTLDAEGEGTFRARIATLAPVVDKDGDVTLAGAFPNGKRVLISAYMHGSWASGTGALPVGDGVISSDGNAAYLDGKFWLNTEAGRETYLSVKNAADLQEYSYGFLVLDSSTNPQDLATYPGAKQILKSLDVIEVSPVLMGAGVNTGTLAIKSARKAFGGDASAKARELVAKLKAGTLDSNMIAAIAAIDAMTDELDDAVDALMASAGIPDPDASGEAEDDDMMGPMDPEMSGDPMTNPDAEFQKGLSFADHSTRALVGVRSFVTRAKSLADLRAKKRRKDGRVLSATNRTRLNALYDSLAGAVADIRDLLDTTDAQTTSDTGDTMDDAESKAAEELAAIWLDMQRRQAELVQIS